MSLLDVLREILGCLKCLMWRGFKNRYCLDCPWYDGCAKEWKDAREE